MAAGAYKGLTIRIGADTTKLASALRGANSAIYKTQTELRKLSKAAKIDPGNTKIQGAQFGAMASQAMDAASKIDSLKKSIEEMRGERGDAAKHTTIGELADVTDNVALSAATAKDRYNALTAEIATFHKQAKDASGIDLAKAIRKSPEEYDKAIAKLREWASTAENADGVKKLEKTTGMSVEGMISHLEKLRTKWGEAGRSYDDFVKVESLHNAETELTLMEAKVKEVADAMAHLGDSKLSMNTFEDANNRIQVLDAAAETVTDRFQRLDQALELDPSNLNIVAERSQALADKMAIAEAKTAELQSKIDAYEGAGYGKMAEDLGNVSLALEKSRSDYADAEANVAKYEGAVANAEAALQRLKDKDAGSGKFAEDIERASQEVNDLNRQLDEAKSARTEAFDRWDTAKACSELKELRTQVIESKAEAKSLDDAFDSITIRSGIASGLEPLNKTLRNVTTATDTAASRFDRLDKAAKLNPHSIDLAAKRVTALREALHTAEAKASELRGRLDAYKSDGIDKLASKTKDAALNFEKAQQKVREAERDLAKYKTQSDRTAEGMKKLENALYSALRKADTAAAVNEFRELETQVVEAESKVSSLKQAMHGNFSGAFSGFGAAAVQAAAELGQLAQQAGQKVIESSNEIDAAYRDLRKTFDASEQDYQMLYDAAMKYSQANVTSADQMLEMEAIAGQLGVGLEAGADGLRQFAEAGANLDVATDIDAETIALQMGQIMNVMDDVQTDNIDKFGDALVRLGNNMPTQESNIMQITQRLAAVGNTANFTTPQLMGWAAAIASTGQKSEAAASGIATTITNISKAVGEGGDAVAKYAEVAQMSADEFVDAWKTRPHEVLREVIKGLSESGDEVFAKLSDLDVNGVRQTQTLAALAKTYETVDDAVTMASDAFNGIDDQWGKAGDAAIEAGKKAEGFSGSLSKLQNSVQIMAASVGSALVPIMNSAAGAVQELTKWLDGLDDGTKSAVVGIGAITAAIGTVAPAVLSLGRAWGDVFGKLVSGVTKIGGGIANALGDGIAALQLFAEAPKEAIGEMASTVTGKLASIKGAISGLGSSFAPFLGIVGAVGAALATYLIGKFIEAKQHAENLEQAMAGISQNADLGGLQAGAQSVDAFADAADKARMSVDELVESVKQHNERNRETRESAEESVAMLGQYQAVIDEMAGKHQASAEEMAKLQWALDGIKEATGETFTAEQVLYDSYKDQEGKVHDLSSAIDTLIQKKQEEARINALSEMYTDTLKEQLQAEREHAKAEEDLNNARKEFFESARENAKNGGKGFTDEELNRLFESSEKYKELNQHYEETAQLKNKLTEESQYYANAMGEEQRKQLEAASAQESWANRSSFAWQHAAQSFDISAGELNGKLQEMGISGEQLASILPEHFAHMAIEANGNIDLLIEAIRNYNAQEFEDKHSAFIFDEEGNLVSAWNNEAEWNQSTDQWEPAETGVNFDSTELEEGKQKITELTEQDNTVSVDFKVSALPDIPVPEDAEVEVKATADDTEVQQLDETLDETTSKPREVNVDVKVNGSEAAESAGETTDKTQNVTTNFTADTSQLESAKTVIEEIRNAAAEPVTMQVNAEVEGVETVHTAVSEISAAAENPVTITVDVNADAASTASDAVASIRETAAEPVTMQVNAEVEGVETVHTAVSEISAAAENPVTITVDVNADAASTASDAVASIRETAAEPVTIAFNSDTTSLDAGIALFTTASGMGDFVKTATYAADIKSLQNGIDTVKTANSTSLRSKTATFTAKGNVPSGDAKRKVDDFKGSVSGMGGKSVWVNADGSAVDGSAARGIQNTIDKINSLHDKTVTIRTREEKAATGGWKPGLQVWDIPKHAAGGFIATRPTLTNYGWIGEDGAELYSGGSLVPLTNRKYSLPYIKETAEEVARKLAPMGKGNQISVTVTGVTGPDEVADAIARKLAILDL